jgi:aryl-alcohol dehydrogenase-like predicted oxidoreductase
VVFGRKPPQCCELEKGAGMASDDIFTLTDPGRFPVTDGHSISRIIVGGWQFSKGHRANSQLGADATELFAQLVDRGFTTFDCADIYEGVEELIGRFLVKQRQSGHPAAVQVHTKFVPDLGVLPTIDKAYVERIINRSLERLGVERLDLLHFHWWDFGVPTFMDVAHWLKELQDGGKIRDLGVTNFDREHLDAVVSSGVPIVSDQVQYSVLDRRPERELAGYCQDRGIVLLCYGALAGGFLTDHYLDLNHPPDDPANRSLTKYQLIIDEVGGWPVYRSILDALRNVAERHQTSTACVALRWVLDQTGVAATITGVDSVGQANQLLEVFKLALDEVDRGIIEAALQKVDGPEGPVYGLERKREGPHGRIMRYNLNKG